jgi:hypothetical protein
MRRGRQRILVACAPVAGVDPVRALRAAENCAATLDLLAIEAREEKPENPPPADIRQLMEWWRVTPRPPYWYLRCSHCDLRRNLRTQEAHEMLPQHGQKCAAKFLHAAKLNTRVIELGPTKERV